MMNSGVRLLPRQIDNFAIGFLLGSQSVGIYKVAKEFANMLGKLIDPLYQLAFPDLSQKINRSDHEMRMLYLRNLSLIGLALGLTFLFLSVFVGEFAIETLYGLDFSKAYVPMLILIFAQLLSSVTVGFYAMQLAFGRARAAFTNQLISVVIYSLLLLPLVDTMGISGGALCYIFYYVAASCLVIFDVRNFSKRYA
jgi:O-antigen/teichoic acid export membrane protein